MTNTLLNIAAKIDQKTRMLLVAVSRASTELGIPYVVVGATARDLVLHYGHGARVQRATRDIDFAIEVATWGTYDALKDRLCERGFKPDKPQHRLLGPEDTVVDIIPFGPIEDTQASIAWPPGGEVVMSVLGFQDAYEAAEWVRVQNEPEIDVPVATPPGMALLKLIAWMDRGRDKRQKDALDIAYLLSTYEYIQAVTDALYDEDNNSTLETYGWDMTLAAAHLLGRHANRIARSETRHEIARLASGELGGLNLECLAEEMCERIDTQYESNRQRLAAFMAGMDLRG